jgi:hypothetical protein
MNSLMYFRKHFYQLPSLLSKLDPRFQICKQVVCHYLYHINCLHHMGVWMKKLRNGSSWKKDLSLYMASALLPRDMQNYLWIWAHHQKSQIKRYSLRHKDNKSIWLYFHDPGLCIRRSVHSKHLAHQSSVHIKNKLRLTFRITFNFIGDNSTSVIMDFAKCTGFWRR